MNPDTWQQPIKREIAIYGTDIEAELTGVNWGLEVAKRFTFKPNIAATDVGRMYAIIEDDMSFMEPIFLEKQLPFPEYLVSCGYHPMTEEILNKQKWVSDDVHNPRSTHEEDAVKISALAEMIRKYGLHFSAKYEIPTVRGTVFNVSVISGKMFYSRTDAPYEVMGRRLEEVDDDEDNEPMAYQTDEQLMIYLAKLIAKAKEV